MTTTRTTITLAVLGLLCSSPMVSGAEPVRLAITEVASTSGAPNAPLMGLDWWELTNAGLESVSLDGYAWEDRPVTGDRALFPNGITLAPGESIIIHEMDGDNVVADAFRQTWNLAPHIQILQESQFTGANTFSGLGSGGDEVHLFNAEGAEVASVVFAASTSGVTFEWSKNSAALGLSVAGENGAYASSYGGIGAPGYAVPEPVAGGIVLLGSLLLCASRAKRA